MPKSYLRYVPAGIFNIVGSPSANIVYVTLRNQIGKFCAVAACEHVFIWDIKKGEKVDELRGDKYQVTYLSANPDKQHLAIGYSNGCVKVFDLLTAELKIIFNGHKSEVTCLNFDNFGGRLVSGAKDTELIVWDIVNEAGLYRLKGHKNVITFCCFMKRRDILISSSKDTLIKFWDLETQHCFKTIMSHISEVWSLVLLKNDTRLITCSTTAELSVWDIKYADEEENFINMNENNENVAEEKTENEDELKILNCVKIGTITRQKVDRVISLVVDPAERLLGVHGSDKFLELFKLYNQKETQENFRKRQKKARKALKKLSETDENTVSETVLLRDEIKRLDLIKLENKPRSFDLFIDNNVAKIIVLFSNNLIEAIHLSLDKGKLDKSPISIPGHRSTIRELSFSSDNATIMSVSKESVKIWNRESLRCVRTMSSSGALTCLFVPGDRHCIVGTKIGILQIFDIASNILLQEVKAHESPIFSLCLHPLLQGFVSGGEDMLVKFWDFELILDKSFSKTSKRLTIVHKRTLEMSEPILNLCFSPNQKLIAVSLLDCTVKVFFNDTLKFFLSLYGHKLPIRSMDISSDSTLIVTGSDDRNIKIWGLDFGDCHKSIFAHDDSVTSVKFIPKTHMFFSVGKDKKVKQWDADNFEKIITLEGHLDYIMAVAISSSGNFVVSASNDKSVRLWEKTEEPLVLEEEGEMEREAEFEKSLAEHDEPVVPGENSSEVNLPGKHSIETVKATEKLMEAIEVYKREMVKLNDYEMECQLSKKELPFPPPDPLINAYGNVSPLKFVLIILKQIKSSELEESLLTMPFSYVADFFLILNEFMKLGWDVELACRCFFFLLRIHHGQITSNQSFISIIEKLRTNCVTKIRNLRDTIGVNLAGLQFLQKEIEADETVFFVDATNKLKEKKKKLKRKAILTLQV